MARTVLFLYNDPTATEAMLGGAFTDHGFDVATFCVVPPERAETPALEVEFPNPARYDVIVPLGARWPVYDDALRATWVGAEMALLREAAAIGVPLLGICFGGQLIAQAFGGDVARSPVPEIGWYDVESHRPDLVPSGPWFEWHFDRWTLPPGAIEVARTPNASQAFVLDRALALQFHPEVDRELVAGWLEDDRDGDARRMGLDHDELIALTAGFEAQAAQRLHRLVGGFLSYVSAVACPS